MGLNIFGSTLSAFTDTSSGGNTESSGVAYDLISEGEIQLVNGLSSIYLNRTPIVNPSNATSVQAINYILVTFSSSTTFTIPNPYGNSLSGLPVLVIGGAASGNVSSTAALDANNTTVNTVGSFFTSAMINGNSGTGQFLPKIRISNGNLDGTDYVGSVVSVASATQAVLTPALQKSVNGYLLTFDFYTTTTSISAFFGGISTVTLASAVPRYTGGYMANLILDSLNSNLPGSGSDDKNFNFVLANFRTGRLNQPSVINLPGFTNASLGVAKNTEIKQLSAYFANSKLFNFWGKYDLKRPSGATGGPSVIVNASEVAPGSVGEVDELLLTLSATNGLYASNSEGKPRTHGAVFQIIFKYKNGAEDFKSELIYGPTDAEIAAASILFSTDSGTFRQYGPSPSGTIKAASKSAIDFDFRWSIEQFKPFTDFQVEVIKVTPDNMEYNNDQFVATTTVKALQAFINDKLAYPYAAYGALAFDSLEFAGEFPERAYHCYGVRMDIPSNYVTREEASDGVAAYTRNVSTGFVESSYQIWDGTFRWGYCNNPVWNLREILLNKRWGLGHWIDADSINNYSFYSMARYCDELVPDGNGGVEPRFTCGVYLTEATEAYKVIRDFCTMTLAIPYWVDGQILIEGDRPAEPIYVFTKGNIEGGIFSYEGTGNKTRPNQIAVRFNNRDNFYEQDLELVDDVEDMVKKNRIFSEEVTAFGATSRGQAIRYGKWKLLTSKLQKEVVSFKTGENAAYLKPGSVVGIQDADRNSVRYSGRLISGDTSSFVLDSAVNLSSTEDYYLHVFIEGPAVYLIDASATFSAGQIGTTTTYEQGAQLPATIGGVLIDTEKKASEIVDENGNPVNVQFIKDAHLETKLITTSLPYTGTSIAVGSAFTSAPAAETIWAITVKREGSLVAGSTKLYKVLNIGEDSPGSYNITAAEHYNSKFDLIDEEYLATAPRALPRYEEIPSITDFTGQVITSRQTNDDLVTDNNILSVLLSWSGPRIFVGNVSTLYANFDNYELTYTTPSGEVVRITLPKSATTYTLPNVVEGLYEFTIRARSNVGPISNPSRINVSVFTTSRRASNLAFVLPTGGSFDRPIKLSGDTIETSGTYRFTADSGRNVFVSEYRPTAISENNFWFDTTNNTLKQWNGSAWVIGDETYYLSSSSYSVNEGSAFTVTLTTTGVADSTSIPYTITGVTTGDISGGSLTGNFVISGGTASRTITVAADVTLEGPEIFRLALDSGYDTVSVAIADTSVPGVITGDAAITLGAIGVSTAGTVGSPPAGITGDAAITLGAIGVSTAGTVTDPATITGNAAITLGDIGVSTAGTVSAPAGITGAAAITLDVFGLSSAGTVSAPAAITGAAAITLDAFGLSSAGTVGAASRTTPVYQTSASNENAVTVNKPTGTAEGDLLIGAFFDDFTSQTITIPSGWTAIGSQITGGAMNGRLAYIIAGPSEPASYTWSISGGTTYPFALINRYTSFDASVPVGTPVTSGGSGTSRTIPDITTVNNNSKVLNFSAGQSNISSSITGSTLRVQRYASQHLGDQDVATAGLVSSRSFTQSSSNGWISLAVEINGAP